MMDLLRDDPEFADAIGRAARDLGDLDPSFVEKDYWVTQVLRALHAEYPGAFLLKGGTSLSKGYGIIERFSEDIDILIVPPAGASNREREAHLRAITGAVAGYVHLSWDEARPPGRGRDASRGDFIRYATIVSPRVSVGIGPGTVLLETGYAGGHEPAEMVSITPLLCEPLRVDPREFADTSPFELRALEPVRTLIEKLFALHHIGTLYVHGETSEHERFGRHYYDVFKLLDHPGTLRKLRERDAFHQIVSDVERVSAIRFRGTTARPDEGFATSPAFSPGEDGMRAWIERNYQEVRDLLPRETGMPTLSQVLKRVGQHAELL
jgi:hypothetical protein